MTNREIALQWWNEMNIGRQYILAEGIERNLNSLTGNEIERIYNAELDQITQAILYVNDLKTFEAFKLASKYVQLHFLTGFLNVDCAPELHEMCIKHLLGFQAKK